MLGLQGTDRVLYVFAILMTPQTRVPCPTPRANKRWLKDTVLSARVVYVARPVENSITLGSMMESMKIGQREEVINLEGKPWEDTTVQCFFTSKWEEELATSVQRSSILTLFFVRSFVPRRILNRHTQRGSFKMWVVPFKLDPPRLLISFCWSGPYKGWEYSLLSTFSSLGFWVKGARRRSWRRRGNQREQTLPRVRGNWNF